MFLMPPKALCSRVKVHGFCPSGEGGDKEDFSNEGNFRKHLKVLSDVK